MLRQSTVDNYRLANDADELLGEVFLLVHHLERYKMRCPKCGENMVEEQYDGITVDRCSGCDAIYFDAGETEQLVATISARASASAETPEQRSSWLRGLFKKRPASPAAD